MKSIFLVIILVVFVVTSFSGLTLKAEAQSLRNVGMQEARNANASDPGSALRRITEERWRQRINEVLIRLKKKNVKINNRILAAVIEALGIDPVGPFSGQSWDSRMAYGNIASLNEEDVRKVSDPYEYIEDVVEEVISNLKANSQFDENPELSEATNSS